jgi:hypothetical protein
VHISKASRTQDDWAQNTCTNAIKQPSFTPVIDREGAIITFNMQGNPVHGITTRAYDPVLKKSISIRELTRAELDEGASLLQQYYRVFINKGITTVVVHCNDLKQAAEKALNNTQSDLNYFMEADIRTGLCQVFKETGGVSELIASEKVYYPEKPVDGSDGQQVSEAASILDAESAGQVFKSTQGQYQMPLPGGVGTWEHMSPSGGQDVFVHVSNTPTRSINIQWVDETKSLDSAFARWKEMCQSNADLRWQAASEKRTSISGCPAVACRYDTSLSNGKTMYTTCALIRSRTTLYIINVQSTQSYQDSEDIFKQSCARMVLAE